MKQISYSVSFTPAGHVPIPTYEESDIDIAISKAIGIYNHMPFPHEVKVIDSDDNLILLLIKHFKNI